MTKPEAKRLASSAFRYSDFFVYLGISSLGISAPYSLTNASITSTTRPIPG